MSDSEKEIKLENGYTKIANELLEKFCRLKLSSNCWRVLFATVRKTYSFHKKQDWFDYRQICELTNLPKSRVSEAFQVLRKHGIVTQTRNGNKIFTALQKDFVTEIRNSYVNAEPLRKHGTNRYGNTEPTVTVFDDLTGSTKETIQKKYTKEKKENIKRKNLGPMQRPTLAQIQAYCKERKNTISPEKFMAHYEAAGWMMGNRPMLDWKQAIQVWEKNERFHPPTVTYKTFTTEDLKDF